MDISLIKRFGHFLAVVEEGHFGRAARRLGMSQPPLTAQIQALERGLGVRLLDRSPHGTRPTPEGEILLPAIRRLEEAARACCFGKEVSKACFFEKKQQKTFGRLSRTHRIGPRQHG